VSGLRERKKERTRVAIQHEALRLIAERGYEATTCEQIAAAAEVSAATLFRYFPTKEDLLVGGDARRLDVLRDAFADRPAGEPVLASVRGALMALAQEFQADGPDMVRRYSVIRETPSLTARILEQQAAREDALAAAIAQRMQPEPGAELRARVLAATGLSIMRVAIREWINSGTEGELAEMVAASLDVLARELEPIPAS
jgi:AcrR family transcriptional regulator